jgi:ornithine--oxo-acid transaminase
VTLILDEIQTGLGRTGRILAEEHEDIVADVTLVGKALGGGVYPVSAVLSTSEVLDVLRPGQHGSTFGGNPLACAVARMALRVLVEEDMIGNAERLGAHALARLRAMRSNVVREVRGRGLMLAVELDPEAGGARPYVEALRARGVLAKDTHGHTIRLSPPLMISRDDLDFGLDQVSAVLAA